MNRTSAFGRKLIYLVILVATLVPLYLLGQPTSGSGDAGGRLTEMRNTYNIAEADLGEISPASETMKLASLGLRGVAATLLWNKADDYRIQHEWDRLKASLNQIALLQPHYDKVWEHQAHNLAYNVSIEFDDYRQRYEMVREGTEYLTRGVRQNQKAPRLIWYTGWFYGQKLGMSDEKRQFRRLFSEDEVLHKSLDDQGLAVYSPDARGPEQKPDNWLVGRLWLNYGYGLVDDGATKIRRQTPLNFFETGPKWRIKHAESIEEEGILDFRAQAAWEDALKDWEGFGKRNIPTTSPFTIKLGSLDELIAKRDELREQFIEVTGEAYEIEKRNLIDSLPPDLKDSYNRPEEERTEAGKKAIASLDALLVPKFPSIAKAADKGSRLRAKNLLTQISDLTERIKKTSGYRTQINFEYWRTLAIAEAEKRTIDARKLVFDAEEAASKAELEKALKLYDEAFEEWAKIFDDYPVLTLDDTAEDLFESVRAYMKLRDSEEIPDDFPLKTFAEMIGYDGQIDLSQYEIAREQQKSRLARRKQELEAEEKRKEEEAKAAEAAEAKSKEDMKKEEAKEEPKDESKEEPKDEPKEEPKDESKEEPKDESKEEPKDEPKEEPKDEPKEEPKDEPKEEPKDEPKEEPKSEPKEEPKPEPKEEPKLSLIHI